MTNNSTVSLFQPTGWRSQDRYVTQSGTMIIRTVQSAL